MYSFVLLESNNIPWDIIHKTDDSTIYKTKEWFDYLKLWKGINPFVVEISKDGDVCGYFVGEIIHQIVKIVASPFEGIGTAHQGLSMLRPTSPEERIDIYDNLAKWTFAKGYGHFMQIEDWQLSMDDCDGKVKHSAVEGYLIDLTKDEDVLFHNLHQKSARYSINKANREGVIIRETEDIESFIKVYYDMLIEVFAKQNLTPTYGIDCVEALVHALYPQRILLLEAVSKEGDIIATGLFPGDNNLAVFWGGASYQRYQKLCPNELLIWSGITSWKARGTKIFDMCGIRQYKLKFGPKLYTKPRIQYSKYPCLIELKELAKKVYYGFRNLKAKLKK